MSHSMNRRRLMAGAAVAVPVAGLASLPALADAGADAELLAMRGPLVEARAAWDAAIDHFNDLEERYAEISPERPEEVPMPKDLLKTYFRSVLNEQELPADHPYHVWNNTTGKAHVAAKEAWSAECDRLKAEIGVEAAEAVTHDRMDALDRLVDDILDAPARSPAGMLFKVEAVLIASPDIEDNLVESLRTDLESLVGERLS